MSQTRSPRFRDILEAARERTTQGRADTMLVSGHLAQMRLFMIRQGIEFYPKQDTFGFRKLFLQNLVVDNELDARLEGVIDDYLIDGKGVWFARPVAEKYRLQWFPHDDYRAFYNTSGDLDELWLVYSFEVRAGLGLGAMASPGPRGAQQQWVKLVVRNDVIIETISWDRPSMHGEMAASAGMMGRTRTVRNSLGFIPAVECFNNMKSTGMDASGEFDWLESSIITHDDLVANIRENIRFFGNPTLLSSRPKGDIVVADGKEATTRPTIASQAGFGGRGLPSTRVSRPTGDPGGGGNGTGFKIPRIIANLEPTDRVNYITPDAVSGDQNLYARQYREEVRAALGGVDELGITSGATAYEIKSLFGRAATTAARKCRGLLTYGLCKLLALLIANEERIFKESFAVAVKLKKPEAPLQEKEPDPKKFRKLAEAFDAAMAKYDAKLDQLIREAVQAQQFPPGVTGLVPDGDRTVDWRWRGPVFEDSPEDILNKSIVVRNLQELGVNSIQALQHLFPDKTEEERSAMLSGYPFRMAKETQSSIAAFISILGQMQAIPHPQSPNVPLMADPRLDMTPYLYRAFDFLKRELTYAGTYRDTGTSGAPAGLTAFERSRTDRGFPAVAPGGEPPAFVPDGTNPAFLAAGGTGTGFQSVAGGAAGALLDRDAELPTPGSVLARDPLSTGGSVPGAPTGAGVQPAGNAVGAGVPRGGVSALPADGGVPGSSGTGTAPGGDPFAFLLARARQRPVPGGAVRRKR